MNQGAKKLLCSQLSLALAALAIAVGFRHWLEASMLRHMLLQLPLLGLSGWSLSGRAPRPAWIARFDAYGVSGLTALLFISAYWMIPRALELSLASPLSEAAKIISLFTLGYLLPASLARSPSIVQLFFLGNFGAMMAIAGMQYQEMPQRLCNAYRLDDQVLTGDALVAATILIAILWCARLAPALGGSEKKQT